MMRIDAGGTLELTSEQEIVASEAGPIYVEACPGAGKTRTLVERFMRLASQQRGVAVLSFTNAAADEVRRRCGELRMMHLTRAPNFVGTFDSFVLRYVLLPGMRFPTGAIPRVVESWADLRAQVRMKGVRGTFVPLDALEFDGDSWSLRMSELPAECRTSVQNNYDDWLRLALRRREQFLGRGFMSCYDVRIRAAERLRESQFSASAARALKTRFTEIIVDEAQDCADNDLSLLLWLRSTGINVTVVADPEQSIYLFRDARPEALERFVRALPKHRLTRNFRSTPNICAFSGTLRASRRKDEAVGRYSDENLPVSLVGFPRNDPAAAGRAFATELARLRVVPGQGVVLAHRRVDAERAVGEATSSQGRGRAATLARAVARFQIARDARARAEGIVAVERMLLAAMPKPQGDFPDDPQLLSMELGIDYHWLRQTAIGLLGALPLTQRLTEDWLTRTRAILASVRFPSPYQSVRADKNLRLPRVKHRNPSGDPADLPAMTIHQAKGREFDAVLLVMPTDAERFQSLWSSWIEPGASSESTRVTYVGATRARRLLWVAVSASHLSTVEREFAVTGASVAGVITSTRPKASLRSNAHQPTLF